ncbi:hypothetical protein NDU88_003217 [Pleurodeles waltl]|uniref:Uncharacterized protein n=1 Tax=Pleurodeles waltl TaxID=8319 RepID=A0AAV7NP38_PLEWA|nr:hypothetical protein NDU88_003217 [Pleurodeles waltl]
MQQEGCRRGAQSEGKKDSGGAERGKRGERKAEDRGTGEEVKKEAGRERGEEEERAEEEQNTQQEGCRRGAESEGKKDSGGAERGRRGERKAEDRGTGEEDSLFILLSKFCDGDLVPWARLNNCLHALDQRYQITPLAY